MSTEFAYHPLPDGHVRILDLHPGKGDDPLAISLSTERFGATPYSAVSYCWGSTERPHKIRCGHSAVDIAPEGITVTPAEKPNGFIRITESLRGLLLAIRSEETYLRLWIDSVCINQADLAEKAVQVASMNRIYENAHGTLVYVGPWGRDADAAWRCATMLSYMKNWSTDVVQKAISEVEDVAVEVGDGTERSFEKMWLDFTNFLSRDSV